MAISTKELKRRGVSDQDIRTAHIVQDAQRRTGSPVQSIGQILNGQHPIATEPANLTQRQLRKRGRYGAAALLTDQEALTESDGERALKARHASAILKELARKPAQLEFDFFKGNRMIADEFHDAVRDRLGALNLTVAKRGTAVMVLAEICRHLPWEGHDCSKTAADLSALLKMSRHDMSDILAILESIGAIHRIARGRTKVITVTPEGAFRGRVDQHAAAVDSYRKTLAEAGNVVPLRPAP
jgi:hypothetical protein